MEEFPYHHDKKPDASRRRELRRAGPVLAAAAAGLIIGTFFENGQDGGRNPVHPAPDKAKRALCSPESNWRNMPDKTDWKFLASLLHVGVERAMTAQINLVK